MNAVDIPCFTQKSQSKASVVFPEPLGRASHMCHRVFVKDLGESSCRFYTKAGIAVDDRTGRAAEVESSALFGALCFSTK
jgi:hypothetical protein